MFEDGWMAEVPFLKCPPVCVESPPPTRWPRCPAEWAPIHSNTKNISTGVVRMTGECPYPPLQRGVIRYDPCDLFFRGLSCGFRAGRFSVSPYSSRISRTAALAARSASPR